MENIAIRRASFLLKDRLVRVGDISFFEGPLLSLFEDFVSNELYLYDWVDRDANSNRWLIYKVASQELLKFLNKKISQLEMFRSADTFFVADINNESGLNKYIINKLLEIPAVYIPNEDSFFEVEDCPSFDMIFSFVSRNTQNKKQENGYSFNSNMLDYFSWFSSKKGDNILMIEDTYSRYAEGSYAFNTHIEIATLPENQFDFSGAYYIYEDREVGISKIENSYA